MAEKYIKQIQKVLNKGTVFLKVDGVLYRLLNMEIRDLSAIITCRSMDDEKKYRVRFRANERLMYEIVGFGLRDKEDSIFVISVEKPELTWFETSMRELAEEIKKKEMLKGIRRRLKTYEDMEEI